MTVNTLPTAAEVTSGTQTNAQQKVDFASMLDFLLQQLGAKSGQGPQTVASAATIDFDAVTDTRDIVISGTTAITAVTIEAGKVFRCRASGAFTLTNNSSIVTQTGANIVCAAGDSFIARATAANTIEILNFSGQARTTQSGLVELATLAEVQAGTDTARVPSVSTMQDGKIVMGTAQATTSGSEWGYTSIPSWIKEINYHFMGFKTNGSNNELIQIGDSGGYETSGYLGAGTICVSGGSPAVTNNVTGFLIASGAAANVIHGTVTLRRADDSTNTWTASGNLSLSNSGVFLTVSGTKSLSTALDRVRLITADTGAAGSVNISML